MESSNDTYHVEGYGKKDKRLRKHWVNVTDKPDKEIIEIDNIEDNLIFKTDTEKEQVYRIRKAITLFEYCHHKAYHRVQLLIKSIGALKYLPKKTLEEDKIKNKDVKNWLNAYYILKAWVDNEINSVKDMSFVDIKAIDFLSYLGDRTPLKVWQINKLIHRFFLDYLNFDGTNEKYCRFDNGPDDFSKSKIELSFYKKTINTILSNKGKTFEYNLGTALDLFPLCSWNYKKNLINLLKIINNNPKDIYLTFCGDDDFNEHPKYSNFIKIKNTLNYYHNQNLKKSDVDNKLLNMLGEQSHIKIWLVRSLERTLSF